MRRTAASTGDSHARSRAAAFERRLQCIPGNRPQQVDAADDANHLPVAHDRDPLYVMGDQQPRNLANLRFLAN